MEVTLKNVGIIKDAELEFKKGLNLIIGASSSGKSTLLRAIRAMMDNSFSDSHITHGEKKLVIQIKDGENTASYIRDLSNATCKSAYKINQNVYTKVGRTPPDELSALFKISPVDIDGEKINFNFSNQFAGPFLLLGSQSLLYSILTYRSSFDITKINDLYFSDLKKTKQETNVLIKTKENLEQEIVKLNDKFNSLKDVPTMFTEMQKVKNKHSEVHKVLSQVTHYKELIKSLEIEKEKLNNLNNILIHLPEVSESYLKTRALDAYIEKNKLLKNHRELGAIEPISDNIKKIGQLLKSSILISKYTSLSASLKDLKPIYENLMTLPTIQTIEVLTYYNNLNVAVNDENTNVSTINNELMDVQSCIDKVGVCPLCNQPLNTHTH